MERSTLCKWRNWIQKQGGHAEVLQTTVRPQLGVFWHIFEHHWTKSLPDSVGTMEKLRLKSRMYLNRIALSKGGANANADKIDFCSRISLIFVCWTLPLSWFYSHYQVKLESTLAEKHRVILWSWKVIHIFDPSGKWKVTDLALNPLYFCSRLNSEIYVQRWSKYQLPLSTE